MYTNNFDSRSQDTQQNSLRLAPEMNHKNVSTSTLNTYQQEVVDCNKRFLRVVAPAGAGKTLTLIKKAESILDLKASAEILCLAFTNAAKKALEEKRSESNLPLGAFKVRTVNSYGFGILRELKKITDYKRGI